MHFANLEQIILLKKKELNLCFEGEKPDSRLQPSTLYKTILIKHDWDT